jgi:hypothetical protein
MVQDFIKRLENGPPFSERYTTVVKRFINLLQSARPAGSSISILNTDDARYQLKQAGGPPKTILIRDNMDFAVEPKIIDRFFERRPRHEEVDIQDPTNESSNLTRVTMDKVKEAFTTGQTPINVLDLRCDDLNPFPIFMDEDEVKVLWDIKARLRDLTAHRPSEDLVGEPVWKSCEIWHLLGKAGALTEEHQDLTGFRTWVKNLGPGIKWWAVKINGIWDYFLLYPGDTVIMGPGVVHAVGTLGDALCIGGHFWLYTSMVSTLSANIDEIQRPSVTNDHDLSQIQMLISGLFYIAKDHPERLGDDGPYVLAKSKVSKRTSFPD